MKWYGIPLLIIVFTALFITCQRQAEADHLEVLPGLPTTIMKRVIANGYVTYALDQGTANYPGFRSDAAAVAQAGLEVIGFPAVEVSSNPDIWLTMPDDATFINICGQGAAGCVAYWADPVMIYFRRALLYSEWRTTIGHEGLNYGHAQGQNEQYFDSGGRFQCDTTATYTVMSCGTGIWRPQPFDRDIVWRLLGNDVPAGRGFRIDGDWATISWGQTRQDNGLTNSNATRVSFFWLAPGASEYRWVGELCGSQFNFCFSPYSAGSRSFDSFWRGCFAIRAENPAVYAAPQPSAPDYLTWVGCW